MHSLTIAVGCLLVSVVSLSAQETTDPRLSVGARVRVESAEVQQAGAPRAGRFSGTLVARRADSLFVERAPGAAPRPVALSNVRGLWVSQGRTKRNTLRGATIGALVLGATFAAIVAAEERGCDRPASFGLDCLGTGKGALLGFTVGGVLGGAVGGTVGFFRRSERWDRIR